jgi:hypothetical protein
MGSQKKKSIRIIVAEMGIPEIAVCPSKIKCIFAEQFKQNKI